MMEGVFHTVKDLEDFLDDLGKMFDIQDQKHPYIIDDVKRESFLSDPNMVF